MKYVKESNPLFSIAIPTYNRVDSLREIVDCYINQDFKDFEIIIANDYIEQKLSHKILGVENDSRVRIVNNKKNLGELENMNFLLTLAKGKYFTWQFDDDPCSEFFLSTVASAIFTYKYPESVFSAFETIYGENKKRLKCDPKQRSVCYSGPNFVEKYLNKEIKALGCCGFYKLEFLKQLGGVTRLSSGSMALFSEFLLLVKQTAATKVAYLNAPLVSTRHHPGSWTYYNNDIELFEKAGLNYICESYQVLNNLDSTFKHILFLQVVRFVLASISVRLWQNSKSFGKSGINKYIGILKLECSSRLDAGTKLIFENELDNFTKLSWRYSLKAILKCYVPFRVFNLIESFRK